MQLLESITVRTVPQYIQEWTEEELNQYYLQFLDEEAKRDVKRFEYNDHT